MLMVHSFHLHLGRGQVPRGLEKAIFRQEWFLTQAISALRGLRQDLAARLG